MMETIRTSEKSVLKTARRHIPEDCILQRLKTSIRRKYLEKCCLVREEHTNLRKGKHEYAPVANVLRSLHEDVWDKEGTAPTFLAAEMEWGSGRGGQLRVTREDPFVPMANEPGLVPELVKLWFLPGSGPPLSSLQIVVIPTQLSTPSLLNFSLHCGHRSVIFTALVVQCDFIMKKPHSNDYMCRSESKYLTSDVAAYLVSNVSNSCPHSTAPVHWHPARASHDVTTCVSEGLYCPLTFDGLSCWNYTLPGETAVLHCPHFVTGFDPRRKCSARHS
jgi:hypothetical protein